MAARVADALRAAGAEPVLAVGGDRPALRGARAALVADRYPGEGPLGGILSAFAAVGPDALVAVVATDLPDLGRVGRAGAGHRARGTTTSPWPAASSLEPLCAVWRRAAARPS